MSPDQTISPLSQLPVFAIIFFIFYFLIFKPQKDKQKQHKEMVKNLKKNDEVVTTGGVHGTVVNIKETTIIIRVDDNVKFEVDKEAVSSVKKKQ